MAQVVTKGLVIREQPYQESDKILTILTEREGKQKAIAKGARRVKNSLAAATQLFAYSEFVYFPGKNFAAISSAALIEPFYALRQDLNKMTLGSYILELLNAFFDFHQGNPDLLRAANHLLYYLSENMAEDDRVLIAGFQMKGAAAQGIKPALQQCTVCGTKEGLQYFNIESGGTVCRNCFSEKGFTYKYLPGQAEIMLNLMQMPVRDLRFYQIESSVTDRILDMMDHYLSRHLDKKLSAYRFYKEMTSNPS